MIINLRVLPKIESFFWGATNGMDSIQFNSIRCDAIRSNGWMDAWLLEHVQNSRTGTKRAIKTKNKPATHMQQTTKKSAATKEPQKW